MKNIYISKTIGRYGGTVLSWIHLLVLLPFICAVFIPIVYKYLHRLHTGWFVLIIPVFLFINFSRWLPTLNPNQPFTASLEWFPSIGLNFSIVVDGLSLLFALLITGIGSLVVLYSIYYLDKEREALHNFYIYLLLFMGSMLGVVLSDNVIVLYTFWELTSISSFLLIAYWYERKKSRAGAQKAMLITIFGGLAMLAGMLLLYVITSTFSIREMIALREQIVEHSLFIPAMLLLLLGAFTKSVQFPFHIWLPDAMEAPTPISAYLHSATMVKAGIYLVCRFTPIFGGSMLWLWIVAGGGLITLFIGSFFAVKQRDLKALLAYSTISQLGLIMCLLGLGSSALHPAFKEASLILSTATLAGMFHLVNHSVFKGCLFMIVGIVDHETGTRDIRKLGGLISFMPISFTLMLISGLSMAGLPPFNGFLSKEMMFTGSLVAARELGGILTLFPVVIFIASIFTFIYSFILIFKTFTGKIDPQIGEQKPKEAPLGMLVPPLILAALVIIIFFFPNLLSYTILEPVLQAMLPILETGERFEVYITQWHGWNMELGMTIGIVILGGLMYLTLPRWTGIYQLFSEKFSFNYVYELLLQGLDRLALLITDKHMTGSVRTYLIYIFSFMVLLICGVALYVEAISFQFSDLSPIAWYEPIFAGVMVLAALLIIFVPNRLWAIISLSVVGFLVVLFFVFFRAPDLALTQLVVETITTALFLLCFYFLPKFRERLVPIRFQLTNLLISLLVGGLFTLLGLMVLSHRLFEPISSYYEDADLLAGAYNMVNAILVDFRGFDTMLETIVLLIAGIGVYTLIKLRPTRRSDR